MLAKKPLSSIQRKKSPLSHFLMLAFPPYLLQRIQDYGVLFTYVNNILYAYFVRSCVPNVSFALLFFILTVKLIFCGEEKYEAARYVVSSVLSLPLSCTFKHSSQHAALRHRQCLLSMRF